jgi:hypothetical protein
MPVIRKKCHIPSHFVVTSCSFTLLHDGKAFVEFVLTFVLALSLQLTHTATCRGGGCLTRHSHYVRVRLRGLTIWRLQCTRCKTVFTVLPHFVLRYRSMRPEVARDALLATHGGLSLELCAVIFHISPMALYRLICTLGYQRLATVLTQCGVSLPTYCLADEKHSRCLAERVYLPTIVSGRVIWHLSYTAEASAAALTQSYGAFQRAASQQEPSYQVKWGLTDGFDSTTRSMRTLFPGVRVGTCLRHALLKLPKKLAAIASPVRQSLRTKSHTLLYRVRQHKSLRVVALGQRLRYFADYVNAIERKLFAMKGFHHPGGSQQAFLMGLAHLYNLIPYQRRAEHRWPVWRRSGRRTRTDPRLVPQSPNPHLGRLAMRAGILHHVTRWNVGNFSTQPKTTMLKSSKGMAPA